MKISEAQTKIDSRYKAGLISLEEKTRLERMIRRTGDYGNTGSWARQNKMRAALINW